ncbi:NHLP bacteriocin export ABC transporter permease/ATPase subunit [Streptomyces solincola]|uniref:NHLP bacteriocin export ABC transporter permease/ATPase subunit n=1 Tax=Streptomyces solincola TaxID=2100817 RepID=A0A2S9PQ40_9ACTN|nr:NHLP bacteriocin export ABC transporter permease/ATPase subunit [Streptomyces solincola]PRH76530.1 NHLP bacteriocin export ABC transporter permease/ATPase subunit [Streptomyces solincola]
MSYALGQVGAPVAAAGPGTVALEGPQVLWLVTEGALDLFAVDAAADGPWHFLGRLEAGALLLGPVDGARHTLVGRPVRACALRRIPLRELSPHPYGQGYADPYGQGYAAQGASPLEEAFALGAARALGVLLQAPLDGRTAADGPPASSADDMLWMPVPPGSVHYGAYDARGCAELLVDGGLWQRLVDQQYRLLSAVDRWIERLERAHEDRTAAGIEAGEAERARADRTLLAALGPRSARRTRGQAGAGDGEAAAAVCRRVARAAGITPPADGGAGGGSRPDPVERFARAARVRTRTVRLTGDWWRTDVGPLVGCWARSGAPVALLWRRGRYEAVNPVSGLRLRLGPEKAAELEPRGTMFYRPLPPEPLTPGRLLRFSLRGAGGDLRTLAVACLATVLLGALAPIATGRVLGAYVPEARTGLITQAAVAVMAASVVSAAFLLTQNLTVLRLEGRVESALQPAVWDRLLRLPARFFAGRSTGELASAAMGVSAIRRVLTGVGPVVVQGTVVGATNVVLLFCYSVPLALAALAVLTVVAVVFLALGLWQVRWQRQLVKLTDKLSNQAYQTLRGLPKLRVAAAESFAYAAWAEGFARSRELQRRAGAVRGLAAVLDAVYLPLCSLIVFMLLAGPAYGSMPAGDFLTFSTSVTMLLASVTQLTGALVSAVAALPLFEQVRPVLDEEPEAPAGSADPGELTGALEVRNVSFRYADDAPLVLDDVSFAVRPGEFVAVVGPSGCGKSTLLRLLIGFERPASGSVRYDGQDLAALDRAALRRQCGVVLQDAVPTGGSVLECITGAEPYTQEEVWAAAELAGLADDIRRMPMGLHTMVAGGAGVSGGQRQRLMIAQALIRRPRVLLLDEATSALDNAAQRTVIDATRELAATRLVIAHRLSTVMDADRVLVLSGGRVVEQGPPAALLADPAGELHDLVRRQMT